STETTTDYGDSLAQDATVSFGGGEIGMETNGYGNQVLATITGAKMVKGWVLRSGDDIARDGSFAYKRLKSNGKYRYSI
ncbi:major tail protein, partial [Enterococcus faecalis]